MSSEPLVSVLMSIYKESVSVVSKAINSIREQTYRNLEIVVMLDYPDHEDMKVYLQRLAGEEMRLRYYINERNLGLLESLNRGINLCCGDFICRMDEDDFSEPDRIEKQMNYMVVNHLDLVGSYTRLMNMKGELTGEIRRFPTKNKYLYQYLKYDNAVPHPTWLVKKEVYERLKGYRDIPCADDYDFLIRASLFNCKMGVVPEPLLQYRINQKGMTQRNIASQKIVLPYLASQIRKKCVFPIDEIKEYRKKKSVKENKLTQYYAIGKKWKMGEKTSLSDKFKVIFNSYNFVEIRQRLACRWILFKDNRYDNC